MSQEHTGIIRASYDAFNKRDWDTVRRLVAKDCEWIVIASGRITRGGSELAEASQPFWTIAVPDLRVEILNLVTEADTVVVEWSAGEP